MIYVAIAVAVLTGFNPFLTECKKSPVKYLRGWAWRLLLHFGFGLGYAYFALPALTGPFWGLTWPLVWGWSITAVHTLAILLWNSSSDRYSSSINLKPSGKLLLIPACCLLAFVFRGCAGAGMWQANAKFAMIGKIKEADVNSTEALKPLSLDHLRVVSAEQAAWQGDKVMSEAGKSLGSKFHPGKYNLQKVGDSLTWVSFLEYNAFRHWTASDGGTPGYITVSAEDLGQPGKLVTHVGDKPLKLRYVPSAYFGDELSRKIYSEYPTYRQLDIHRELDDQAKPWFVVTLGRPSIHYTGDRVELVLLVDPQTGEMTPHKLDAVPAWVDRVFPEHVVEQYLTWWGSYGGGWLNSWWWKDQVVKPTHSGGKALRLVWGKDGQCYWFTGVTSVSTSDQALVSFILVNSRTGEASEYRTSGIDESAAVDAVNAAVSNYDGWHGSDCVLYHLYGEWAYVIPVLANNSIYQRLAIVRLSNGQVALGKTKGEALREFQRLITNSGDATPSEQAQLKTFVLSITQKQGDVQDGRTVYYFEARNDLPGKVLTGTSALSPFLATTVAGDRVKVGVLDTDQQEIPLQSFERLFEVEKK